MSFRYLRCEFAAIALAVEIRMIFAKYAHSLTSRIDCHCIHNRILKQSTNSARVVAFSHAIWG